MTTSRIEKTYALTPMQHGMLFHHLSAPNSGVDVEQIVCDLHEALDLEAMQQAWQRVAMRHPALRTGFRWEGLEEPLQEVWSDVVLPFRVEDWREVPDEEREARFAAFLHSDRYEGFDLSRAPLLRLHLFRLGDSEHRMVWTFHHALLDGRSFPLVLTDVFAFYEALRRGDEPELEPPARFEDHIDWLARRDRSGDEAFWRELLRGCATPTPLPGARAGSGAEAEDEGRGDREVRLSEKVTTVLRKLAAEHEITLNTVIQGAWALLLSRYGDEEDVVFGATRACRRSRIEGADAAVGLFINTLPVRVSVPPDASLISWLQDLRTRQLAVRDFEDTPLIDVQRWSEVPAGTPLFESILVFDDASLDSQLRARGGPWAKRRFRLLERTSFPVTLHAYGDESLRLEIAYERGRLDDETIERMLGHLRSLLEGMAIEPDRRLSEIPMLSAAELQLQLSDWNATRGDFAATSCVHELFEEQVKRTPDRVAAVCGNRELTYRELNGLSNRLARHLRRLGVGPDVLVGICAERSLNMLIGLLGILKAGGAYLPLDPSYPAERLEFMLEDANAQVLLTQTSLLHDLPGSHASVVLLDAGTEAFSRESAENLDRVASPQHLAYVIYTSGSTGKPKGVMVEHENVTNFFAGMDRNVPQDPPGTWLALTSLSFDISVLELFWTLARGFKVVLHSESELQTTTRVSAGPERRELEFSLFYFPTGEGGYDEENKYRLLMEGARFADANGFTAVWTPERHFHAFGGLYPNPPVASAALAVSTERVQIRSGSVVAALHSPIRLAEDWALVDNLSGGRVGLGVAAGWHSNDFAIAPENYADRKEQMFESVETVRKLWRGETIERPGPKGPVEVRTFPRPLQPELPIWITTAGSVETYRRAGEIGANILTHLLGQTVEELEDKIAVYRKAFEESGHGPGAGHVTLMLHTLVGHDIEAVRELARGPMMNYMGTAADLVMNHLDDWAAFSKRAKKEAKARGDELQHLSPEDVESLLDFVFERYFETAGLFGTPHDCLDMVERVRAVGVDEIACLIDFGVSPDTVIEHLKDLNTLRQLAQGSARSEAESPASLCERHGVSHVQCTPSLARLLVADYEWRDALGSLRAMLVGGETLPGDLARELRALVSGEVINMYGPTETTIWSSTHPVSEGAGEAAAIGRPILNTEFYVLDRHRLPVPIGVPGELYIGGKGVARGYLNRSDLSAERFVPDPFRKEGASRLYRTGDVVRYREDGILEFLGRRDDQIKIRGHRIELGEVEAVLARHPAVREAAVVTRVLPSGPALVGYYVPVPGTAQDLNLGRFVRERLPEFMVPSAIVAVPSLPLTPNGKIDRKALPEADVTRPELGRAFVAPRTPLEEQLARIWSDVLGFERVGIHDNFFDIGGNSLSTIQIAFQIRDALGVQLPLRAIFRAPTVAGIAEAVEDKFLRQADDGTLEDLLDEVEQLSEDEARSLTGRARA